MTLRFFIASFTAFILVSDVAAQNELRIPAVLEGTQFDLTMAPSSHEFFAGSQTNTYGFNGSYLGPTLILEKGETVTMNVTNNIGEPTTVHWHGMHVAPEDDGGPHSVIDAGATWSPQFEVLDNATTFWYHPHLHEHTSEHVYRGLAGMIIVRDEVEASLALPRTYGVDDIPLVIQDRQFIPNRQFLFNEGGVGQQGTTIVVNGTVDPFLEAKAGIVRLRLLNGSNSRVYQVGMSDNSEMKQIGSDGGLLQNPVSLTRIRMAPGERAEILVDLNGRSGESLSLMSYSSELTRNEPGGVPAPGAPPGPPGNIDGTDFELMELRVVDADATSILAIPDNLVTIEPILESETDRVRPIILNTIGGPGTPLAINGVEMDLDIINEIVQLGDTEIWELQNRTGGPHPFHIHDIQFQILDRGGQPPAANEAGWKDVVLVYPNETVRFITRFLDFADPVTPFMYHCHFLGHEDGGMMGQFIVIDPAATAIEHPESRHNGFLISSYPNPTTSWSTISYTIPTRSQVRIDLFDSVGRHIKKLFEGYRSAGENEAVWKAGDVATGIYFIRMIVDGEVTTRSVSVVR